MELAILIGGGVVAALLWNAVKMVEGSGRFAHVTEEQFLTPFRMRILKLR